MDKAENSAIKKKNKISEYGGFGTHLSTLSIEIYVCLKFLIVHTRKKDHVTRKQTKGLQNKPLIIN